MKKLSESLREFADHAENTEKKIAAAEKATKEKVQATLTASKADAKARQDAFKTKVAEGKADAASDWQKLQADHNERMQKIKSKIQAQKDATKRDIAGMRADDAEDYAVSAIYFASMALDDAEVATLEAIDARAYADSLN